MPVSQKTGDEVNRVLDNNRQVVGDLEPVPLARHGNNSLHPTEVRVLVRFAAAACDVAGDIMCLIEVPVLNGVVWPGIKKVSFVVRNQVLHGVSDQHAL